MSHFVVMVTNTDKECLDAQLEPFSEQGNEEDYFMEKEYYLKNDKKEIEEYIDNWIKENESRVLEQKNLIEQEEDQGRKEGLRNHLRWLEEELVKFKEIKLFKTQFEKLDVIHDIEGGGMDEGGLYWVSNPNAKWDWWVEGGRWDKWLIDKNGKKCNSCLVKDLDLDAMRIEGMVDAARYWIREKEEAKREGRKMSFWNYKDVPSLEEYVKSADKPVAPYAILHDGEWIGKGEMGWWGIDDPNCTEEEWSKKFQEFIEGLDPETEITIVDCHI